MRSAWLFSHKKFFLLMIVFLAVLPLSAQESPMQNGEAAQGADVAQDRTAENAMVATRHEVFSYEAANLALRLPEGTHLLVISGPMDTYMLGHLRNAIISNRKAMFSLDLSAVSALFDMDKEAFNGCRNLVSVVIPDGLVRIRWQCFLGCENLIAINATENCDSFASSAGILYDKTGTELVVCPCGWDGVVQIPLSVASLLSGAFANCPKVTGFALESRTEEYELDGQKKERTVENEWFSVQDGILYSRDMKRLVQFPGGKSGRISVPETVQEIGKESFAYCNRVTAVELPPSVRTIEKMAFGYCAALETVTIPASVTSIGKQAFVWCTSLGDVRIPAAVSFLGSRAFFKSSVTAVLFEDPGNWTFGKKILVDLGNPAENAEKFRHPGKYWFLDLYKEGAK